MTSAFFITGTDTGAGKTFATCAMLYRAKQSGILAAGLKPVASGLDGEGKNEDVEAIRKASGTLLPDSLINTYRFAPAIAPHIAARQAGCEIRFSPINKAVQKARKLSDLTLVEGVGGFFTPLGQDGHCADLAVLLDLPVILVIAMRLGCINHALLTAEAITARKLPFAGWIGNILLPEMPCLAENISTLQAAIPAPCLGILPYLPEGAKEAARFLKWPESMKTA